MSKSFLVPMLCVASACAATSSQTPSTPRALTPAEEAQAGQEPTLIATLDRAIGPKFTADGDRFTATIVSGSALRAGTRIVGRVLEVQAAMAGTMSYAVLTVNGIETESGVEYFDGRIAGVELFQNQPGGREVNASGATGSEVVGAIIQATKIPQTGSLDRDPLGRGTVISMGTGGQSHQLEKGTRIRIVARPQGGTMIAGLPTLVELPGVDDPAFVAGQHIVLDDVLVQGVIGDVVFWVAGGTNGRTLVVLDLVIDEPEVRTVIEQGTRIRIEGTTEPMPKITEAPRLWKMVTAREAAGLAGHTFFVHATRVTHK